jgi:hypothetical protein
MFDWYIIKNDSVSGIYLIIWNSHINNIFLSYLFLSLPTHWRCSRLLLYLNTVNVTHSAGILWMNDQPDAEISTWQHTTQDTDIHAPGRIRTHSPSNQWPQTHALQLAAYLRAYFYTYTKKTLREQKSHLYNSLSGVACYSWTSLSGFHFLDRRVLDIRVRVALFNFIKRTGLSWLGI